jgi:hypothetical protein
MSRVVSTTTTVRNPRTKKNQGQKISNGGKQPSLQQPKRKRQRRKNKGSSQQGNPIFTQCAMDYYKALVDPWAYRYSERLPCIPDLTVVPSMKFNTTVIGTLKVGTNRFGYIAINPHILGSARGIGWHSLSTYTGTVVKAGPLADPTIAPIYDATFPYDGLTQLPAFRLVAAGVRIKYTGTELNRSGQVALGSNDAASNNFDGFTYDNVASQPDTVPQSVTRGHRGCVYKPLNVNSTTYQSQWDYFDADAMKMVAVVTGEPGNEFAYEIVRFWEAISDGTNVVNNTSASHSDLTGVSKIRDFIATTAQSEFGQSLMSKGLEYFKKQAVEKGPLLLTYL